MKSKLKKYKDEKSILTFSLAGLLGYSSIPVVVALVVTPLHELLHFAAARIVGAEIIEFKPLIVENWISQYILIQHSGPLGKVVAGFSGSEHFFLMPPELFYYMLPYIVLFPLGFALVLGDNIGISNNWRIIGAPMIFSTFVAFWYDYALYAGIENPVVPVPSVFLQAFYVGVVMVGITGSTFLSILREKKQSQV